MKDSILSLIYEVCDLLGQSTPEEGRKLRAVNPQIRCCVANILATHKHLTLIFEYFVRKNRGCSCEKVEWYQCASKFYWIKRAIPNKQNPFLIYTA